MDVTFTLEALAGAALIFGLRVFEMTLGTLRILYVMRGRKLFVWVLGFLQAGIFVVAIGSVVTNLDSIWNLIGYAAGFATGNVVTGNTVTGNPVDLSHHPNALGNTWSDNICETTEGSEIPPCIPPGP